MLIETAARLSEFPQKKVLTISSSCCACRSATSSDCLLRLFLGVRGLFSDNFLFSDVARALCKPKSFTSCTRFAACLVALAHHGGIQTESVLGGCGCKDPRPSACSRMFKLSGSFSAAISFFRSRNFSKTPLSCLLPLHPYLLVVWFTFTQGAALHLNLG